MDNKEQLTINQLAPYLPYRVMCQYEGIINGKELANDRKEYLKENDPFPNLQFYEPIAEIKGIKYAPLKQVVSYKHHFIASCGNRRFKNFYNASGLKMCLRPLSDLTKEIEHKGERFVPFNRLSPKLRHEIEFGNISFDYKDIKVSDCEKLYEWHFAIGIPEHLYIDINTITNG